MEIFVIQWLKNIEQKNITGKLLCSEKQKFKISNTETYKLLDEDLIPEISTWTYGNKVALFIWSDPFYVILIDDKSVANSNRKTFNYLWKLAKIPGKKHLKETRL